MKKTDRRVIKTKNSIRKAFNTLILEKDLKSITITDIAKLADVDRKTFYLHYNSTEDILEEFKEEVSNKVLHILNNKENLDIEIFFKELNDIMMEDIEVYRRIAEKTTYMFLLMDCKDILKESIIESFYKKSNMTLEVFSVYAEYIACGIIGIYTEWLTLNSKLTLKEITEIAKDVVQSGWKKIIK